MSEQPNDVQGREESGYKRDHFDIQRGSLDGLVGILQSRPTTVQAVEPLVGITRTFIVQTIRHTDDGASKDYLFVQFIGPEGSQRFVFPPKVVEVIARQRAALVKRSATRRGKDQAAGRGNPFASLSPAKRKAARLKALATRREKAAKKRARG